MSKKSTPKIFVVPQGTDQKDIANVILAVDYGLYNEGSEKKPNWQPKYKAGESVKVLKKNVDRLKELKLIK